MLQVCRVDKKTMRQYGAMFRVVDNYEARSVRRKQVASQNLHSALIFAYNAASFFIGCVFSV
jgi:hypothetical protein